MKIIVIILLSLLAMINLKDISETTYDEEFEDRYQVEHLREGDGVHYPEPHKFVRMKFKGFIPATGQVFDSTDMRGGIYEFLNREDFGHVVTTVVHPPCWNSLYPRMSSGEKIVIICMSEHAFGKQGLILGAKVLVKPGETVAYEIEMLDAHYNPTQFKLIRNGVGKVHPRFHDLYRYKLDVYIEDQMDYMVFTFNSGEFHLEGGSFDNSDCMCVTEALRQLTVGGQAWVTCPFRYNQGAFVYPHQHIPVQTTLTLKLTLLSLFEMHWDINK
jgi:FKBP-type peptidyl-prolyl cis-trans isomerase